MVGGAWEARVDTLQSRSCGISGGGAKRNIIYVCTYRAANKMGLPHYVLVTPDNDKITTRELLVC